MTVLCTIFRKTISETRLCTNVEQTNFVYYIGVLLGDFRFMSYVIYKINKLV